MNSTTNERQASSSPGARRPERGRPRRLRAGSLDPEADVFLQMLGLMKRKAVNRFNLHLHRLVWHSSALALGRADTVASVETLRVPGPFEPIVLRLYRPSATAEAAPAFIWFHGGGFVMGGLATADAICRHIAMASGAIVVAVRYRLAPEYDLYAGRADCMAAMDWISCEGHTLGIDTTRLAVGGDSAGGNLAAAVAQRHTASGGSALRLQVLAYPATNLVDDFASKTENARGYMLTEEGIDAFRALFRHGQADLADPWISPAFTPSLHDLPPAVVVTAGYDPIRDDGLAYAGRLREAGVPVELLHYAGQFHGFLNFDGVLQAARDALDRIGAALRRSFDQHVGEAAPAIDRTIELTALSHDFPALPGPVGRNLLIASLMLCERLEGWRWTMTRCLLPDNGWITLLAASPLLNPAAACQEWLAQRYAQIEANETYRASADGASRGS